MNTNTHHLLTLGAALLLASLTSTFAQTWETVDELTPWASRDIVADSAGNFISLAIDNGATTPVSTAVNLSTDQGATWETVGLIAGYALDLTSAPDGALFAVGNRSATVSGKAFLWQSLDQGVTWTEINPWAGQTGTFLCHDIAAGNSTSIYLCGSLLGGSKWIVRKGDPTAGGITWTTVDNIPGDKAEAICVRPSTISGQPDEIIVSGSVSGLWTIRRSANGGTTWATVDSYSTGIANGSYSGVATGPDNSIYTVGRLATTTYVTNTTVVRKKIVTTVTSTTVYGWLVRKSANGGASWANVDYSTSGWPGNAPIAVDKFGRVFVVGGSSNPGTVGTSWLVRGSTDGGVTWVTTDTFLPPDATRGSAYGVAADALGNVCVAGVLYYPTSVSAPIRRLAAP